MVKKFNIYKEGSFKTESDLTVRWLGPSDLKFIETKEITFYDLIEDMISGNRCLGLIKDGKALSYLWVNDKFIKYFGIKRKLKENECYFYNGVTNPELRGKGYAEIIRSKSYEILREQGKDTFYSISDLDNKAAIRLKEKLGAEIIESYLFFKFWKFKYLKKL